VLVGLHVPGPAVHSLQVGMTQPIDCMCVSRAQHGLLGSLWCCLLQVGDGLLLCSCKSKPPACFKQGVAGCQAFEPLDHGSIRACDCRFA
jgi:hypothetical protein